MIRHQSGKAADVKGEVPVPSDPPARRYGDEDDAGPPPFSDSAADIEMARPFLPKPAHDEEGDAPPGFSMYNPEFQVMMSGNIVSHDSHLNEDGEALCRFLLSQSTLPPCMTIQIHGTHTQVTYVDVTERAPKGEMRSTRERETETITDFKFSLDLTPLLVSPPELYTVPEEEPTFRGHMFHQVGAKGKLIGVGDMHDPSSWVAERERRGRVPWSWMGVESSRNEGKTVREWADDFCASDKILKEFDYKRVVYGWDLEALEAAIQRSIRGTLYDGVVAVTFSTSGTHIFIRPTSQVSRLLMTSLLMRILLWMLCIYPFILLFKYCHPHGGGRWAVAGEAWCFRHRNGSMLTEGQWFSVWGPRITRAAEERAKNVEVIETTGQVYPTENDPLRHDSDSRCA